jgi:dTDP-4-amino-4,6-dideoxygalactose transaminase
VRKVSDKTKAILPVHLNGMLCDMGRIDNIATNYGIHVIEDCAHALDTTGAGFWGPSCYSFYPTKSITCGEGGAISCWSELLAEKLRVLRNHGMNRAAWKRYEGKYQHWEMEELGYKMNMTNLQGKLLLQQLGKIKDIVAARKSRYNTYNEAFKDNPNIRLLESNEGSSKLYFNILVDGKKRDEIVWQLQDKGLGIVVNWIPVHLRNYYVKKYGYKRGDFPHAEDIGDRTLGIPFHSKLTEEEQDYVIKCVEEVVGGKNHHLTTSPKRKENNSSSNKGTAPKRTKKKL